jgi:phosphoenolpyruvate phosphomutase
MLERISDKTAGDSPAAQGGAAPGADAQGGAAPGADAQGRWIGLLKVSRRGLAGLKAGLAELKLRSDFASLDLPDLLNLLIGRGEKIEVMYVHGHWRGVNDLDDLQRAVDFANQTHQAGP